MWGVAVVVLWTQAYAFHHGAGSFAALCLWNLGIHEQGLFQNGTNFLARVQGTIGVLKNDLHFGPQSAQRFCCCNRQSHDLRY
jgi:hypothetical protein